MEIDESTTRQVSPAECMDEKADKVRVFPPPSPILLLPLMLSIHVYARTTPHRMIAKGHSFERPFQNRQW